MDSFVKTVRQYVFDAEDYFFGVSEAERIRRGKELFCIPFEESNDYPLYQHSSSLLRQLREQIERENVDYALEAQEYMIERVERLSKELPFPERVLIRRRIGTMSSRLEYRIKRRKRYESV